jgi:hypothetical protein
MMRPWVTNWSTLRFTVPAGMAKATPADVPVGRRESSAKNLMKRGCIDE